MHKLHHSLNMNSLRGSDTPPIKLIIPTPAPPRRAIMFQPKPAGSSRLKVNKQDHVTALQDYQNLFLSQRTEAVEPVTLRAVYGSVPADFPSGTYYLAGPGIFKDDYGSTVHPLDGHGYIRAFHFNDGLDQDQDLDLSYGREVKYMARYIETEAQLEEHDNATGTWRFTHRGPFSVLMGGRKFGNTKVMKNVANTTVLKWGGKLLCLWEGGDPYQLEPHTLDTIGIFEVMDDRDSLCSKMKSHEWHVVAEYLKPLLYGVFKMPAKRMLSHYKIDNRRDRLLTLSCNAEDMLLPRSNFTFCEFDSGFNLIERQEFSISDQFMIHDWAFTDSHYILFGNRVKLDPLGSMAAIVGLSPMISAISVNPSKPTSPIYLLPRFPDKIRNRDWRVPVEVPTQLWLLHVGNAFEIREANGDLGIHIQASACSYKWFNFEKLFGYDWQSGKLDPSGMNTKGLNEGPPHLVKISLYLDADGNCQRCHLESLNEWKHSSDFCTINPIFSGSRNTYMYASAASGSRQLLPYFPFDTIVKLNVSTKSTYTWSAAARTFVGEPVFASKGDEEDDGYLLVIEYAVSTERCYLVILDCQRIGESDALIARLEVPNNLTFPLGFHGFWAPDN